MTRTPQATTDRTATAPATTTGIPTPITLTLRTTRGPATPPVTRRQSTGPERATDLHRSMRDGPCRHGQDTVLGCRGAGSC